MSPGVPTSEAQRRLHREYRSTKVAGCNLPDGALAVRDAWTRCKTRRLLKRVFWTRVEAVLGFLRQPNLHEPYES